MALGELVELKGLKHLRLHRAAITDAGIKELADRTELRELDISSTAE